MLRTTYAADDDGEPQPTVHDDLTPGWATHDLSELSERARRLRLEVLAQREFGAAVRPERRCAAAHHAGAHRTPTEHVMLLVAHHIAWDDGCWQVFFADLTRAYSGDAACAAAAPARAGRRCRRRRSRLLARGDGRLRPSRWNFPGPTGRRSRRTSGRSAPRCDCPPRPSTRVTALARDTGATPYMVLLAAFGALIHRYTHADDFLVATPVLNRGADPTTSSATTATPSRCACARSAARLPRAGGRRPATPRSAPSPTSASTSTGWCASSTPTAATAPSG